MKPCESSELCRELRLAKQRANFYAKHLAQAGYNGLVFYQTPNLLDPDLIDIAISQLEPPK